MSPANSRPRDAGHGEPFSSTWTFEAMLNLVKDETGRIDAPFLEPSCGNGNTLVAVLRRKLAVVDREYWPFESERRHFALLAVMSLYGIGQFPDSLAECRARLLEILAAHLALGATDELHRAAAAVLARNFVLGEALSMCLTPSRPVTLAEWSYLGRGEFQRRDLRFDNLIVPSPGTAAGLLYRSAAGGHDDFALVRIYPPMTVSELAAGAPGSAG